MTETHFVENCEECPFLNDYNCICLLDKTLKIHVIKNLKRTLPRNCPLRYKSIQITLKQK